MRRLVVPIALLLAPILLSAQNSSDRDTIAKIRDEGLQRSQVDAVFRELTIVIGPRLTASPAHKRAAEYVRDRLNAYGLSNVHLEPWKFGRGWTLEKFSAEMIEPRYLPLLGYPDAWSSPTPGDVVATPIFAGGRTPEEIATMAGQGTFRNAVVMTQPIMTNFVRKDRPQPSDPVYAPMSAAYATSVGNPGGRGGGPSAAQRIAQALKDGAAAVILKPSIGEHGTVFVTGRDSGPGSVPAITLSAEHYNLIASMLQQQIAVKLRLNIQSTFHDRDNGNAYNVIAELPGVDPVLRDEVVMIGGHLDSWHTGVGATDNADGSATVIEAMRILKAIGARPRRTIRVALWAGEEQGLLGSRAWVAEHLGGDKNAAARAKFDVYFNIDNGTGPIYGWYLQNVEEVRPLFDSWLEPFKDLQARRNVIEPVGSTDHLSFIDAGVPGFNPIQDYVNYDVRTHHTNMDTPERVNTADIRQSAVVMAAFAFNAANADRKIPGPKAAR
jgi:carboxypeptidase Q